MPIFCFALAILGRLGSLVGRRCQAGLTLGRTISRILMLSAPSLLGGLAHLDAAQLPRDHAALCKHYYSLGLERPQGRLNCRDESWMRLRLLAPIRADVELLRKEGESLEDVVARMRYADDLAPHFPKGVPQLDLRMRWCGKGLRGREQLALVVERLREVSQCADPRVSAVDWPYLAGKYLAHCDPPDGLLVPHPAGYYEVFCSIEARGARAVLLKPVEGEELEPLVLYPGTRPLWRVKRGIWSCWADLSAQIGSDSMERLLPSLLPYLREPERGFIESGGDQHAVLGMSLGGALAQSHAYALSKIGGLVSRATLLCSAGIAQPMCEAFAGLDEPPALTYITEYDDCTPELGAGHLGLGCELSNVEIDYYMFRVGEALPIEFPERPVVARGLPRALYQLFVQGLRKAHVRDSLSEPHTLYHLSSRSTSDHERIQALLGHERPNCLELWRQRIGHGDDCSFVDFVAPLSAEPLPRFIDEEAQKENEINLYSVKQF